MKPRTFLAIAWIPLALLVGVHLYSHEFDGWGRWAAAPLFLLPVMVSAALAIIGIAICRREAGAGRSLTLAATATFAAAVPALWFLARALGS